MKSRLFIIVLSVVGLNVQAAELNKTFIEFGYTQSDFGDKSKVEPDGIQLGFGYEFENGIYTSLTVKRQGDTLEGDVSKFDLDLDENLFELGYIAYETNKGRFSFGAGIGEMDWDMRHRKLEGDFYRLFTEYEHRFNQHFSGYARLGYEYFDPKGAKNNDGAWAELGVQAHYGDSSVVLSYFDSADIDQLGVTYRYSF
ncbi:hypothetical protein [Pseudoalteromonas luteoviolacea]|uniref:Outer membrane protein beta-barrel domain-containing protein n=1 Tax=Pseudoalteromonas luteoviolacea H33 TaxID=1365251 RepID=A0A167B468_9GAMM|nr:hypothetical protein [Pseudoalteromonas luteoviolacea]KZN46140.1 hypothetical protein N476_03190 [Pseudoalteromonas luteoviolacea H33]KZN75205.1 hypothetical protein N477_20205 [Pseudoalteromonas luteoviolacea H33-S]MBQ4875779.1 hypothetical protein [Pseudoalteromonas luteoviolacea]MBQ4904814.1 hypothetical protein [Pseudoalteromonas luteoviolacea]